MSKHAIKHIREWLSNGTTDDWDHDEREKLREITVRIDHLEKIAQAVRAFREHEGKVQENQDAGNLKDHVVKRMELLQVVYDLVDGLDLVDELEEKE